jgi:hypothetical protein
MNDIIIQTINQRLHCSSSSFSGDLSGASAILPNANILVLALGLEFVLNLKEFIHLKLLNNKLNDYKYKLDAFSRK